MNIKKELGEKIKRIRKQRNLTQEQLAEIVDISPRNLSGIEQGTYFLKSDTLEKILQALNVTAEELFNNDYLKTDNELFNEITENLYLLQKDRNKLEIVYKMVKFLKYQ